MFYGVFEFFGGGRVDVEFGVFNIVSVLFVGFGKFFDGVNTCVRKKGVDS